MISSASACLGIAFSLSELGLALRRRASSRRNMQDRDGGSLRVLWIAISASISVAFFLAARGVKPWLPAGLPWSLFGVAVFVLGAALRWWSIWHLGRFFTVNVAVAADHRVVDTGPYRFVRHPSYTGIILQFTGLGLAFGTVPSLLVMLLAPIVALLYRIRVEEAALRAHLPGVYAAYSSHTKKIVPLVY